MNQFIRITRKSSNNGSYFSPCIDYLLSYARSINNLEKFKVSLNDKQLKSYNKR